MRQIPLLRGIRPPINGIFTDIWIIPIHASLMGHGRRDTTEDWSRQIPFHASLMGYDCKIQSTQTTKHFDPHLRGLKYQIYQRIFYAAGCILQGILHVIPDIVYKFYICMQCSVRYAILCPILHIIPCKSETPDSI